MQNPPQFLTIGHVTRDILPDGTFSLGGTVSFAALTAYRLELVAAVVSCADPEWATLLPSYLPGISLHIRSSEHTTTFENRYVGGFRTQYLYARSDALQPKDIPQAWRPTPIVLFGPLAQEIDSDLISLFPHREGTIIAATPQGWLRRWDADGRVWPTPWHNAEHILPMLDVLILSHDDLLPFADGNRPEADAILTRWSRHVSLLVATDGRHGATLFRNGNTQRFPAYPINEIDPTGAGDVFAAAFLTYLHRYQDPERAVDFANCVASFSIEQQGTRGIPTAEMVEERMKTRS